MQECEVESHVRFRDVACDVNIVCGMPSKHHNGGMQRGKVKLMDQANLAR